ncbi:MAG: purine-nucleoside phosphorylase [Spirochaetaceae bacterium]|nr:MAG: purine-nucleoside phosphorylase [Spirochaetaceae bacterium]
MTDEYVHRVAKALKTVSLTQQERPQVGMVLGSGLAALARAVKGRDIPYEKIHGFPVPTIEGHTGFLRIGKDAAVLVGRFHYYEGYNMEDIVLPVFLLHSLGVRTIIVINATGGINRSFSPGDLVLIKDHINLMGINPLRGPNLETLGPRFPDMSEPYSSHLRCLAREVAEAHSALTPSTPVRLQEGVYAAFSGPNYETPAEVRMAELLGADMVGMCTVPEVIIANYLGMEVLGISMITQMAAGLLDGPLNHSKVVESAVKIIPALIEFIGRLVDRLLYPVAAQTDLYTKSEARQQQTQD